MAVSDDGSRIAVAARGDLVLLERGAEGREYASREADTQNEEITTLAYQPGTRLLAAGSANGIVFLFDVDGMVKKLEIGFSRINHVASGRKAGGSRSRPKAVCFSTAPRWPTCRRALWKPLQWCIPRRSAEQVSGSPVRRGTVSQSGRSERIRQRRCTESLPCRQASMLFTSISTPIPPAGCDLLCIPGAERPPERRLRVGGFQERPRGGECS